MAAKEKVDAVKVEKYREFNEEIPTLGDLVKALTTKLDEKNLHAQKEKPISQEFLKSGIGRRNGGTATAVLKRRRQRGHVLA